MTHKCNHIHCEHNNVKHCKHCGNVYCVDCGKEWFQSQTWVYPYYYTQTYKTSTDKEYIYTNDNKTSVSCEHSGDQ